MGRSSKTFNELL